LEIRFEKTDMSEGIALMCVETGRDEEEIRLEGAEGWQYVRVA